MGRDNRLNVSHGDRTFEVDVDAVMAEVGAALEAGLGGLEGFSLDTGDWTSTRDRDREMQDLRARLDELKDEVRRLRRELDAREP
jgi:predicted nuclease with TOPRIM domain